MNNQSAQPENPTIIAKASNNPISKKVVIYILGLALFFSLGLITRHFIPFASQNMKVANQPPSSPKPAITESKLPVSFSLLTNPIVYEWRGSVRGKLIKKDDHTFTLADDAGNNITITDRMPSGDIFKAIFYDKANKNKQISLKDISLGSILLGDFFIFKNGSDTPVASSFAKQ